MQTQDTLRKFIRDPEVMKLVSLREKRRREEDLFSHLLVLVRPWMLDPSLGRLDVFFEEQVRPAARLMVFLYEILVLLTSACSHT